MRYFSLIAALALTASVAYAQLSQTGAGKVANGGGGGGSTGKILLVDGTSFILQTDGTSKICLAAGC